MHPTPLDAITALVDARNDGDIEAALAIYSPTAVVVLEPGIVATGESGARAALTGFVALNPTFTVSDRQILESDDVALHYSRWHLSGTAPDGTHLDFSGDSTDVFHKQPDGGWLLTIDNPYGTSILG